MNAEHGALQEKHRIRRFVAVAILLSVYMLAPAWPSSSARNADEQPIPNSAAQVMLTDGRYTRALDALGTLAVKVAESGSDYDRARFASSWGDIKGCDARNRVLARDLDQAVIDKDNCTVLSGVLTTNHFGGEQVFFTRGTSTSGDIHIEHLVSVSDAWRKGARYISQGEREAFYNDPLNLLAVDGPTNIEKGNKDAASWLPATSYRCRYVARQIAVKQKYNLWITPAEKQAIERTLSTCPLQPLPIQAVTS